MADVFRATAVLRSDATVPVVIKQIRVHRAGDRDFRRMFLDEARVTAHLDHPGIVKLLDVGRIDESMFLAFELVDGVDLRRALEVVAPSPMDLSAALSVAAAVLDALDYAHQARDFDGNPLHVVHRDVSTANVLLSWEGAAKLADFGLALASTRIAPTTAKGRVKGNLYFLAPEQITQRDVTARTDVYQVGMILLRALAGRHPFEGVPMRQVVDRILRGDLPVPSSFNAKVPPPVDALIADALRARAESRYPSAGEFASALRRFASIEGVPLGPGRIAAWLGRTVPRGSRARTSDAPERIAEPVAGPPGQSYYRSRELRSLGGGGDTRTTKVAVRASRDPGGSQEPRAARGGSATTEAIPAGALDTETPMRRLSGHEGAVRALAMTADGKRAVSGGDDTTLRVWRVEGAARLLEGHQAPVTCVATARSLALSGGVDGAVRIWDIAKGRPLAALSMGGSTILSVAIDPWARRVLAGAANGMLRAWEPGPGPIEPMTLHLPAAVTAVAFASDRIAFWSGDAAGTLRAHVREGDGRVLVDGLPSIRALAAGGGHLVAACADHRLRVWNELDREPVWSPDLHVGGLTSVAVSADGSLALSGSEDGTCRLWHLRFRKPVAVFRGHDGAVHGVAFSADLSWILSAGADGELLVWQLTK